MTDNEIIKALELCFSAGFKQCEECPLKSQQDEMFTCIKIKQKNALDLINRQKAEIEKLQKAIKVQDIMIEQQDYKLKQAKSEAIKEFAKKVNPIIEQLVEIMFDDNQSKCMIENCRKHSSIPCESRVCIDENKEFWKSKIDNLVKEMTEPVKIEHNSLCETDTYKG